MDNYSGTVLPPIHPKSPIPPDRLSRRSSATAASPGTPSRKPHLCDSPVARNLTTVLPTIDRAFRSSHTSTTSSARGKGDQDVTVHEIAENSTGLPIGAPSARQMLTGLSKKAKEPIITKLDRHGQPVFVPYDVPPQWYLDSTARATHVESIPMTVSHDTVAGLQRRFASELSDLYNDCRISSQAWGRNARPKAVTVLPEFFCGERHPDWHKNFTEAQSILEQQLFLTHPMVAQLHELLDANCSCLSFFRQMDKESFPIDEELFHQIQFAQIRYSEELLKSQVIGKARTIFSCIPEHTWVQPALLDKFLMSVRRIMSLHLEKLLFNTLHGVLHLFERFDNSSDGVAIFILNLIVDDCGHIRYSPEQQETLDRISSLLKLVKNAICTIPVIQSQLASVKNYNSLMVVSSFEADVMLDSVMNHLADIYRQKTKVSEDLLEHFRAYEFVLSEPYYEFPQNWHPRQAWTRLKTEWDQIWTRSRRLRDEIEVLAEDEEDVGMFVAITSGPANQNLVTEVLVRKALSLGDHIKDTVASYLLSTAADLEAEYEEAYALCTESTTDPKRLVEMMAEQKQLKSNLKRMHSQAEDIDVLHTFLISDSYLLDDDGAFCLFRLKNLAVMLPALADKAWSYLSETKWMVEDELRTERINLSGQLLDFMNNQLQVVFTFNLMPHAKEYLQQISELARDLTALEEKCDELSEKELKFGWQPASFDLSIQMSSNLRRHQSLWQMCKEIPSMTRHLKKQRVVELNVDRILHSCNDWKAELLVLLNAFDTKWTCHQLATELNQQLQQISELIPVMQVWTNPSIRDRHWSKVFSILKKEVDPEPAQILFGALLSWNPSGYSVATQFKALNEIINNEHQLDEIVESMQIQWGSYAIPIRALESTGTFYVESLDEANIIVQEAIIRMDRIVKPKSGASSGETTKASDWQDMIKFLDSLLSVWSRMQIQFLSVRSLFVSKQIKSLSFQETFIYQKIDNLYRANMELVFEQPSLLATAQRKDMLKDFQTIEHDLDFLRKAVEAFVSNVRSDYARFHFVTEQDVLDILTIDHNNFPNIDKHISKLFPGVKFVDYNEQMFSIVGFRTRLDETLHFVPAVKLIVGDDIPSEKNGANDARSRKGKILPQTVNDGNSRSAISWLLDIEDVMVRSVHRQIDRARKTYECTGIEKWLHEHTQQSIAIAQAILFAARIEGILSDVLYKRNLLSDSIAAYQGIVDDVVQILSLPTSGLIRHKLVAISLQTISQRDQLQKLILDDPRGTEDFSWQCQFRYSWSFENLTLEGKISIHVMQHKFPYGLEYLGNTSSLVWSASLERCHKIVASAVSTGLWGALAGNHTTSNSYITTLAHNFGTVCCFFGWDIAPSQTIINQLCKGAAGSCFWLAFKSVDRAPSRHILQVLTTSIVAVQNAIRMRSNCVSIHGDIVDLRMHDGSISDRPPLNIFVTVDKLSNGQISLGSLATVFRPIGIETPDIVHIMETTLLANGVKGANVIAKKAKFAFQMLCEQLPLASQYSFTKSTLMGVINDVIYLKQKYPHDLEVKLLTKALLLKVPSIVLDDRQIFYDIISALSDEDIAVVSERYMSSGKFERFQADLLHYDSNIIVRGDAPAAWKPKIVDLFSLACIRNGVIVVGRACTGKTSCIRAMTDALSTTLAKNVNCSGVQITYIFPKALSFASLFGRMGRVSSENAEWIDGLIPALFRSADRARQEAHSKPKLTFCVLDGQMDPAWSDKLPLTTVGQQHMTLPSFESVPVSEMNTFVFEGEDISSASPATVSKCGIVYFDSTKDAWCQSASMQVSSWNVKIFDQQIQLQNKNAYASGRDVFECLLSNILKPALNFVSLECKEDLEMVSNVHRVWCHLVLFERLCSDTLQDMENETEEQSVLMKGQSGRCEWMANNFLFALVLSLGAVLNEEYQRKFETFLRELCNSFEIHIRAVKRNGKPAHGSLKIAAFQRVDSIFEMSFVYNSMKRGWISWKEMPMMNVYSVISGERMDEIVIPTADFIRNNYLLGWTINAQCAIVVNGPMACGKSLYVEKKMQNFLSAAKYSTCTYNMSPSTTMEALHALVWQKLELKSFGKLAPKGDRQLVVLIEDVSLAKRDKVGASACLELLRHLLDKNSGYSLELPPTLNIIERVQLITTNQFQQASSRDIPHRLLRHFFVLNMCAQSQEDLRVIFSQSLAWYHAKKEFPEPILARRDSVINATIGVYREVRTKFKPNVVCPHYLFSLRDLNAVLSGMMLQTKEDILDSVDNPVNEHLRLWTHEVLRVFYDRIKDAQDKAWFLGMLKTVIQNDLNIKFHELFKHLDLNQDGDIDSEELRRLFFGSYQSGPGAPRKSGEQVGYDEIEDHGQIVSLMASFGHKYDSEHSQPMNLFMSLYSAEHISRIARIFQMPRGHALLLGSTGVGRRSLTRMAAFVGRTKCTEIYTEPEKDPNGTAWRDNMKRLLRLCGLGLAPNLAILLRDWVLNSERMEDVCCILNGIEIPGLFTQEEREIIVAEMKERGMVEENVIGPAEEEYYAQFIKNAYDSMHIVIFVDPQIKNVRDLLADFPSLATRCYIDWFEDWPAETMQQMAHEHLPSLFDAHVHGDFGRNVLDVCGAMHTTALCTAKTYILQMNRSNVHVTLTDYAIFLKEFASLLRKKREDLETENILLYGACNTALLIKDRVKNVKELGTSMLDEHKSLMEESENEQAQLKSLQSTVAALKQKIDGISRGIAQNKSSQKDTDENILLERESIKEWWKTACQCIITFSPRDIGKLKSTVSMANKCPECIEDLAMAVCAILDGTLKPSETKDQRKEVMIACKNIVTSIDFKKKIVGLNPNVDGNEKLVQGAAIVRARFLPKKNFTYDSIARVCTGSEKLFLWVSEALAFEEKVRTIIEPLKAQLAALKKDLGPMEEEKMQLLGEHSAMSGKLGGQQRHSEELSRRASEFEAKFLEFNHETELCKQFCDLLHDDYVDFPKDWKHRLGTLTRQKKNLDVDCLLAAASITYLGGVPQNARQSITAEWIQILARVKMCSEKKEFNLAEFLLDCKQLSTSKKQLELEGLPMDDFSVENACIITRCYKAPLVIDPHSVFTSWIQKKEKSNNLVVVSAKGDFLGKVRFAVQEGLPILVNDVDHAVPQALQSLSSRQIVDKKGRTSVYIGDVMVPLSAAFRMYLATKDECPDFSPEHVMWTTLVDFNLSLAGIEECIFRGLAADKLEPLHIYRISYLESFLIAAQDLDHMDPMHFLPSSTGDLFIDENLIETTSKVREDWIQAREVAMDNLRRYRKAVEREEMLRLLVQPLAGLFDVLWRMTPLHVSYQNVLNQFTTLVLMDLESATENEEVDNHVLRENASVFEDICAGYEDPTHVDEIDLDTKQLLRDILELGSALSQVVFFDLVRSIFEKHHLLFAFMVAVESQIRQGSIHPEEFQQFITDGQFSVPMGAEIRGTERMEIDDNEGDTTVFVGFGRSGTRGDSHRQNPGFSWLSEKQWSSACTLSCLKTFRKVFGDGGLTGSISAHPEAWQMYFEASTPTDEKLPHSLAARLSTFQKLLLLRSFHPQSVLDGMSRVVKDWCGTDVSRISPLEIFAAYEDSLNTIPLLFVLDPDTDPTEDIQAFAEREFRVHDPRQLLTLEATGTALKTFRAVLERCMEKGDWLLVKNVHMEVQFSKKLEEGFVFIGQGDSHAGFRLWVTTIAINLSKMVYRSSMRVVWDAPMSLRAGMVRSYSSSPMVQADFFHQSRSQHQDRMFKRCLFATCMMHAAVNERSAYGPMGWNSSPGFTFFDLKFCMLQVRAVTHSFENVAVKDVRQVIKEFVYAGKFSDAHDQETFNALLALFLSDSLVSHGMEYSEDGSYGVPEVNSLPEFRSNIDGLPTFARASFFGLVQSCDTVRFERAAEICIKRLQDIHFLLPMEIHEDKSRGQLRLHRMLVLPETRTSVQNLLLSMPHAFNMEKAKSKYPVSADDCRNRVLIHELEAKNALLVTIHATLVGLLLCMDGECTFSEDMEQLALSLHYGRVPDAWMKLSSFSNKSLASYMEQLNESVKFFNLWLVLGAPVSMWLPAFFFPNMLFSVATLNFAHHSKVGIEAVLLDFEILHQEPFNASLVAGLYLSGLSLTGAHWDFANGELQPISSGAQSVQTRSDAECTSDVSSRIGPTTSTGRRAYGSLVQEHSGHWKVPVLHVKPVRSHPSATVSEGLLEVEETLRPVSVPPETRRVMFSNSTGRKLYSCPMYRTASRKKVETREAHSHASNGFIIDVPLPCSAPSQFMSHPQHFYVLRSVALLIEPEEFPNAHDLHSLQ